MNHWSQIQKRTKEVRTGYNVICSQKSWLGLNPEKYKKEEKGKKK